MIFQFVALLTSRAQAPVVAGKMAVPAAPPALGMTFEVAEVRVCACSLLKNSSRPGKDAADGRVTTQPLPALLLIR